MPRILIDWMGMTAGIFALYDAPDKVESLLVAIEESNAKKIAMAAPSPGNLCIFGDNIDNITMSPDLFARYSMPYYQKYCKILQDAGKRVSAHMDGRLQGLLPLIKETGLDLVDGATPAPMNDYEPQELAKALGPGQKAWCGVPASMVADGTSLETILEMNESIKSALGDRVILNIGDQVPPDADIDKVAAIARHVSL